MSQVVDRNKVFKSTRVRTSLKNDECWIQRAKQEKKEEELASTDQAVESRPSPARLSSYVLSTVKRFEAVDSPPSTTLQTAPSEGDSANHANGEVIPQKDAQPEGSTVGPTDDAKNQAPTEELNVEAQVETSVANTNAENKEENVAENKGIPEAVSDVKTAEQSVANATAEIKEDQADATIEQPKIELDEPRVATDAPSEDPAAETSAAARTEESKGITEVPEAPVVKLKPEEQPSIETESANVTHLEGGGAKSTAQTAKEVEQVPDVVADAVSESPTKAETAVKSVECEVKSAPLAETVTELNIEDALLEPVPALEDVQDKSTDSPVEQSKALDVEHPKTEAAPEPQDDQNQNSYEANRKTNVCSCCDKFIDGNVKLFLNEPVMTCHPDCLKVCSVSSATYMYHIIFRHCIMLILSMFLQCGVCAMALGDLLTAIFLHGQVIHCDGCFHKTLVI
ncbi:probable serine/threonine-protein kinase kinX isoform X3 [Pseudochaenichthys georgianus]|uniref:probable serine/threonine-protein kinase kinX isoform X3 n=1 Tax=Pseudochaenichthys georgianus TaxID=52239 RepID=UPI00146ECB50|nr:zinc finger protein 185 isoform X3 [Pseudochaenichthys georgianus]